MTLFAQIGEANLNGVSNSKQEGKAHCKYYQTPKKVLPNSRLKGVFQS
jgi:hypothetical protein